MWSEKYKKPQKFKNAGKNKWSDHTNSLFQLGPLFSVKTTALRYQANPIAGCDKNNARICDTTCGKPME
jgi:hypothetical protein